MKASYDTKFCPQICTHLCFRDYHQCIGKKVIKDEKSLKARNVLISFSGVLSLYFQRYFFSSLKPGGMIVHTIPHLKSNNNNNT